MIELLKRIFIGHNHKWVRMENVNVKEEYGDNYAGALIIQQCEICGKLKNHRVKW